MNNHESILLREGAALCGEIARIQGEYRAALGNGTGEHELLELRGELRAAEWQLYQTCRIAELLGLGGREEFWGRAEAAAGDI